MLIALSIHHYALIKSLDVEFDSGFSGLTGETGAGKSIILGALGLALGQRADTSNVRQNSDAADITATFSVGNSQRVLDWLHSHDLNPDDDDTCLLRRTLKMDGRSRAFINGIAVPVAQLKTLGEQLVEIHGQHANLLFRNPRQQLALVDEGVSEKALANVVSAYAVVQKLIEERANYEQLDPEKAEYWRFQLREMQDVVVSAEQWQELDQQQRRLSQIDSLAHDIQESLHALSDDHQGALAALSTGNRHLESAVRLDSKLQNISESLETARIHLVDAEQELLQYQHGLEVDPEQIANVEQQVQAIYSLARKHQVSPEALPDVQQRMQQQLDAVENAKDNLDALDDKIAAAVSRYQSFADALTKSRQTFSAHLAKKVTQQLKRLSFEDAEFRIAVQPQPEQVPRSRGQDMITFEVRLNAGQPFLPLEKAASGGELARIGLALKICHPQSSGIDTLIFDEVDTGIGGGVAEIVGKTLRDLGKNQQVFSVTHLPQVAAQAHHQYQVSKISSRQDTETRLTHLSAEQRVDEIARMLGGTEITDQTLAHAREMLAKAGAENSR